MRRIIAICTGLVVAAVAPKPARALDVVGDGVDLTRGLKLSLPLFAPSAQLDQATGLLPKGQSADDDINWGVALGQFAVSAVLNVGGVLAFSVIDAPAPQSTWSANAVRGHVITSGILQFVTLPLVSATGIYLMGEADDLHDVGYGFPLLANYAAELVLVGVKLGIDLGTLKGSDAANQAADILSQFVAIDYVLHGLVPPIVTTYFSIRSRDPKSISFSRLDRYVPDTESTAEVWSRSSRSPAEPLAAMVPVAVGRF